MYFVKNHCQNTLTFHIGGNAKIFVMPQYIEDLVALLDYVRRQNLRYFVMGNGSNLLAYDTGYDGIVIRHA